MIPLLRKGRFRSTPSSSRSFPNARCRTARLSVPDLVERYDARTATLEEGYWHLEDVRRVFGTRQKEHLESVDLASELQLLAFHGRHRDHARV